MRELLKDARDEIIRLRRDNEILNAKVEVMDLFFGASCSRARRRYRRGYGEDVAWSLQKEIDAMDAAAKRPAEMQPEKAAADESKSS